MATPNDAPTGWIAPRPAWPVILGAGFLLWAATVVVTFVTANPNLLPTIVLLGSFLVPVTFASWAYERGHGAHVTAELLFLCFVVGGLLGVLGASLLEAYLVRPSPLMYIGVGVIEEAVKLAALMVVAQRMAHRGARDGMVLGAAVGLGFAAFESAGYAMTSLVSRSGLDLVALVETEILRGLITPVGHGVWTAILGGVVFAASPRGRWRFSVAALVTFLGVALLHGLWNSVHGIAIVLTLVLTGDMWQTRLLSVGYLPELTPAQAHLSTALDWTGLVIVAAVGVLWLTLLAAGNRHTPGTQGDSGHTTE
ncbi:protease prsW family protein [Haloactinospora alba]|uniref:Protease prsW family protein n=1 Tax=Haloactinospora alba TaxID=405555 RepID=A0A543NAE2_9ACTN|nr:PrsW family glutamic-type intramembrane protease [Haloactinospora alba]TQN28811.1 protease prsW family protein [Haloactinospora alba]